MLQAYHFDMIQLYEEYKTEFYGDMLELEKLAGTKSQKDEEAQLESTGAQEHSGDTLTLDPSDPWQKWKKTEDGWERQDDYSTQDREAEQEDEKEVIPPWAKKLYKKIALVSHPDKTFSDPRKDKLSKVFSESARAMAAGDYEKLLGYALDLDLDITSDGIDTTPLLKKRITDIKQEISSIEKSMEWLWGESMGLPDIRPGIAAMYLRGRGIALNIEELSAMINALENRDAKH